MTPEELAREALAYNPWKHGPDHDYVKPVAEAIREAVEAERKRCVQAVRDYADGIERGMDADGRSPELVASFETALDIADMLEGKK